VAVRTISLWENVPDADRLRGMLATARDKTAPLSVRQDALSYLSGAAKVLASIEKRAALAEYLRSQIRTLKTTLYY
jgi:hypothetical protein